MPTTQAHIRWPGNHCWSPIPDILKAALRREEMRLLQSYKGSALLECATCAHVTVAEVDEDADWSCPACARKKFEAVYGQVTKTGEARRERTHPRTDRMLGHPRHGTRQWDVAA
jgi:ribosomal protein L37AE/L43A